MAIPVPTLQHFSVQPGLSAYITGKQMRQQEEDREMAALQRDAERMGAAAVAAQTPEQWDRWLEAAGEMFPGFDLEPYRDFETGRALAIGNAGPDVAFNAANLDINRQQLDLQRQAFAAEQARANRPGPRQIMEDQNGIARYVDTGEPVFPGVETLPSGGPMETLEVYDPESQTTRIMGWNTRTQAFDIPVGLAEPPEPLVEVNTGDTGTPFGDVVGEKLGAQFVEQREAAQQAVQSLASTEEARRLLDEGVITGFGADFILGFGNALSQIGIQIAPEARANTEAFIATRAQEVGRIIQLFGAGTGLSDADREFATRAAAGQITLNEESIRRILDINERAARNVIASYNAIAETVPATVAPYPLTIQAPPSGKRFSPQGGGTTPPPPPGVDPTLWQFMTPEERALWTR